MRRDVVCRGSWNLGNNCKTCRKCVETATHKCPLCGRLSHPTGWLTHPQFGFRYCPDCKDGPEAVPGFVIPVENPDHVEENCA